MMRRFGCERRGRVLLLLGPAALAALAFYCAALTGSYVVAALVFAGVALFALFWMHARMRRREDERLRHRTLHDSLTGLPNLTLFARGVDSALDRGFAGEDPVAVLFVDLDDFKEINHSYGYTARYELRTSVARRFEEALGPEATVTRLGCDEYTDLPGERLWEGFEAYWPRRAAEGVPPGFGEEDRLSYWEVSDAA